MPEVNFKCKKCRTIFNGDVGKITFPKNMFKGGKPIYEKDIECIHCGVLTLDKVVLTELGKHQLLDVLESTLGKRSFAFTERWAQPA